MSGFLVSLHQWWVSTLTKFRPLRAAHVDDPPDFLEQRFVYLVGDRPTPWSASMLCPCGCAATIQLSLLANDKPSWRANVSANGVVTLTPSVWRVKGCKSHFFVRRGRIVWARETRRPV